jgi:hypothetical protein
MKNHKAGQRRKEGRTNRQGTARVSSEHEAALRSSAKVFWRVLDPSAGQDGFQHIICETVEETEALTLYQGLRRRGFPALVSRWEIYRVRILPKSSLDSERFAFVEAYSPEDACSRVTAAYVGFDRCPPGDIHSRASAKSYEQCLQEGVSSDPELRLFETNRAGGRVIEWVREPMFLLPLPSGLTRKWSLIRETTTQ